MDSPPPSSRREDREQAWFAQGSVQRFRDRLCGGTPLHDLRDDGLSFQRARWRAGDQPDFFGGTAARSGLRSAAGAAQYVADLAVVPGESPGEGGIAVAAAKVYVRTGGEQRLDHIRVCLRILAGEDES